MSSPSASSSECSPSETRSGCPGGINVFSVPHSRMKQLVEAPIRKVREAETEVFRSPRSDLEEILQSVYEAMWELKSHEYIENHFIMDRLKERLQARRVYNQLVCNCHKDSKLLNVIGLIEKVYSATTDGERLLNGSKLQAAIQEFLDDFLHHMEEEETVFQPLLNENFEAKELADMNEMVLKQHTLFREKVRNEKSLQKATKRKRREEVFDEEFEYSFEEMRFRKSYCQEVNEKLGGKKKKLVLEEDKLSREKQIEQEAKRKKRSLDRSISDLPEEILVNIFKGLSPKDLVRSAQVCRLWKRLAFSPRLWRQICPAQWCRGEWTFSNVYERFSASNSRTLSPASSIESLNNQSLFSTPETNDYFSVTLSTSKENTFFSGIIRYLLPKVGKSVQNLIIRRSRGLTNRHVRGMLLQCPNLKILDLSYTNISSKAFSNLTNSSLKRLEDINLEGCEFVNDKLLENIASCSSSANIRRQGIKDQRSHVKRIILSGCHNITSSGLSHLAVHRKSLQELDLSGLHKIEGSRLGDFVSKCPGLQSQGLSYCNDIEDGPWADEANGCQNLECGGKRFCCQRFKN